MFKQLPARLCLEHQGICISGSCEDMRHDSVDIFVGRHPKCSHLAEGYGAFLSWKN